MSDFEKVIKVVKLFDCSKCPLELYKALTSFYKLSLQQRIYIKGMIEKEKPKYENLRSIL